MAESTKVCQLLTVATMSVLNIHCKDWCWSWNSNTWATWCKQLTHLNRLGCWGRLKVGGEGDDRGWDGWMASLTQWTRVWVNSGSWWWTGRPGVLQSMGSQSQTRLNSWTELNWTKSVNLWGDEGQSGSVLYGTVRHAPSEAWRKPLRILALGYLGQDSAGGTLQKLLGTCWVGYGPG